METDYRSRENQQLYKTNCTLCVNSCGLNVYVEDGRITGIKGMPEHPFSKGEICPRAESILEWHYSTDRLKYPLQRVNGNWERISWDEALDTIAERLTEIKVKDGARAFALQCGSVGVEDRETTAISQRFRGLYGTPNFLSPGICYWEIIRSRLVTFGRFPLDDPRNAKCVILWGHDPDNSNFPKANNIRAAVQEGAKLVVINPKAISLCRESSIFVQPRPGTDLALALAMLNVIIGENLVEHSFINRWTLGFDELKQHIKGYTPDWAEGVTSVPADRIREIARMFATVKPACVVEGTCTFGQQRTGFQIGRAFALLQAVTGNVYLPGTWIMAPMPRFGKSHIAVEEEPIGTDEHPLWYKLWGRSFGEGQGIALPKAVLEGDPYPITGMILIGGNFAVTQPDSNRFQQAFKALDFLVVMDLFLTETAKLADIVLPAANFLEKTGLGYSYAVVNGIPYISLRPKIVEPPGECWSEFKFFVELAKRMGYEEYFPWGTEEEFVDHELSAMDLSVEKLSKTSSGGLFFAEVKYQEDAYSDKGFPTPSGKVELYSETLSEMGYDPLPVYEEPSESPVSAPELAREYPLTLITGSRNKEYSHSQLRDIPSLRDKVPEPLAEANPRTAVEYGLADGDLAWVETKNGRIKIRIRATEDIRPGAVVIPHGWTTANVNLLTDATLRDPIMGIAECKVLLCRLRADGN